MTADAAGSEYDIPEASANLARLVERVERGEEIVISRAGVPVAKVTALRPPTRRTRRGVLAGRLVLTDDWDSPEGNDAIAADFGLLDR